MQTERSFAAPAVHSDAWLDYCAALYLQPHNHRRLRARGVTFEAFLRDAHKILAALDEPLTIPERAGLLPEQRRVQRQVTPRKVNQRHKHPRLDAELLNLVGHCANGRLVQKMWRTAYDKVRSSNVRWLP